MTPAPENPPAFPQPIAGCTDGCVYETKSVGGAASAGMSLRQYYKAAALKGLLANPQIVSCGQLKSETHLINIVAVSRKVAELVLAEGAAAPAVPTSEGDFMPNAAKRDWVKCPVCGEPDMRREEDCDGNVLIICVNHACASNGGNNCDELLRKS